MVSRTLLALANRLSLSEIETLLALKRAGPKAVALEARRATLAGRLAAVERRIARLDGQDAPPPRRGRPPIRATPRKVEPKPARAAKRR